MTDYLRDRIADELRRSYFSRRLKDGWTGMADAIIPLVEEAIREAKAEALRDAADVMNADTKLFVVFEGLCERHANPSTAAEEVQDGAVKWLRDRADEIGTAMTDPVWSADLRELLSDVRVRFWQCPVEEHRDRNAVTVEWRGDIAHCTAPDCERTSADEIEATS